MSAGLIEEARRLASFAPEKPESVHDVVCAGFNELTEQLAARTRDFLAAVERNEEKDRRISDLQEQLEAAEQHGDEMRQLAHRQGETIYDMTIQVASLRHALTQVRAECELPDYIAEFIGEALQASRSAEAAGQGLGSPRANAPAATNDRSDRKVWGPERMRHDPL